MTRDNERRHIERVDVSWPITIYYDDQEIDGEAKNISTEGLYVYCEKPLPVNKIFSVSIFPPEQRTLTAKGKVIWSDLYGIDGDESKEAFGIGICLVEMGNEDLENLQKALMYI